MKKYNFLICLILSIPTLCSAAMAPTPPPQDEHFTPWLIRIRALALLPDESSDTISLVGGKVTSVSDEYAPEIDFNYFFTPNISAELILATARHSVKATGTALGTIKLGKVYLLPPTLTALFHIFPYKTIDPYIGGGINYTHFYKETSGPIATAISYDDSWGGVIQGGIDLHFAPHWSFNIDIKKVYVKTDVTVTALGIKPKTTVKINPIFIGVGVGYRF